MFAFKSYKLTFILCVAFYFFSNAQQTLAEQNHQYQKAVECFNKKVYNQAIVLFDELLKEKQPLQIEQNALFYRDLAALYLFNKKSDISLMQTLKKHPTHALSEDARSALAQHYFLKRKWKNAIKYYDLLNLTSKPTEKQNEYNFKRAYALFRLNKFNQASNLFYNLKDKQGNYQTPSQYYYGHIAYAQNNFSEALKTFDSLEKDEKFGFIAPYYKSNILYKQEKYQQLIDYLSPKINDLEEYKGQELKRMLGEAYFHQKEFAKSAKFLKQAFQNKPISQTESYHLGYALYKSDQTSESIEYFKQAIEQNDTINQLAHYSMANGYLKLKQAKYAFKSFKQAAKINIDEELGLEAAFAMAKISYETSLDPYFEAIESLSSFIKTYANTEKSNQAKQYLINVLLLSKNYEYALEQIEQINLNDDQINQAYQEVAFNYANQLFKQKQYTKSIQYYKKAQKYNHHKYAKTLSYFWSAEGYYKLKDYQKAIADFQNFIYAPGAIILSEFGIAHYNIAYCYYKLNDLKNALIWFRKFDMETEIENKEMHADALEKSADIFLLNKDYKAAIEFYKKAYGLDQKEKDYQLFQIAMCEGIIGDQESKKQHLIAFQNNHKTSEHYPASLWHLAKIYSLNNQPEKALSLLDELSLKHSSSFYSQKALLEKGQLYYNQGNTSKAIDTYKKYIDLNQNYAQASLALNQLKKIYTEQGNALDYKNYIEQLDFVQVNQSSLDSTIYESAYLMYVDNNCAAAQNGFKEYIASSEQKEISGIFNLQAHYYLAECLIKSSNFDESIKHYEYVTEQPENDFSENAHIRLARAYYNQSDYKKSHKHYLSIEQSTQIKAHQDEAIVNLMYTSNYLNDSIAAQSYAQKALTLELDDQTKVEALYIKAISNKKTQNLDQAIQDFETLLSYKVQYQSEALYNIAEILFSKEQFNASETKVNELLNSEIDNQKWLAKALILLSDIYVKKNDLFLAKQTLSSIIENHQGEQELNTAKQKLDEIIKLEEAQKPQEQPDSNYIDIQVEEPFELEEFNLDE